MSGAITDDVVRFEIGLLFKECEQLIVQHFHLAHRAVAGMELERTIRRGGRTRPAVGRIVHPENIALNLREHRVVRGRLKPVVFLGRIQLGNALEKFATDFAERREERISSRKLQVELQIRGRFAAGTQLFAL